MKCYTFIIGLQKLDLRLQLEHHWLDAHPVEKLCMLCRSPSRTPSRSPPKGSAGTQSASSQHVSDMQMSSSQHMSESSSSQNPNRQSPLSRSTYIHGNRTGQAPKSPFGALANSPDGTTASSPDGLGLRSSPEASTSSPSTSSLPQADATVRVSVQHSFLAAAKQGRNASPPLRRSPIAGKGSSPGNGMAMAYSASSEDGTSTSGDH